MVVTQSNTYDSSLVKGSLYNYKEKTLIVEFSGSKYQYNGVELEDYINFSTSDSQGTALNKFIKGKYDFEKLDETISNEVI